MNYSVAIRTLGKSPDILRRELESLKRQTIQPQKVYIYIGEGYPKPDFNVMDEIYVATPKGMIRQRALDYKEITADNILLLDDDVELAEDSAEKLLVLLNKFKADCIASDTFKNHKMSFLNKIIAAVSIFVFPHFNHKWAFILHRNGTFSYINSPKENCYPSQSAAGPASLWKKESFLSLDLSSELWLDKLGFSFGEDELMYYKLYLNGGKLFVSFEDGIKNLDGKSSSGDFQANLKKFYIRAKANYIRWHRMHYLTSKNNIIKLTTKVTYWIKLIWITFEISLLSLYKRSSTPIQYHIKGIVEALKYIESEQYKNLPSYKKAP